MTVGLLHPGEMGAAFGAALVRSGHDVAWASDGRGMDTSDRAEAAGLVDAKTVAALVAKCDVIVSICPPHAAREVAAAVADTNDKTKPLVYLDANAVAPSTAQAIALSVEAAGARFVDGGIVGGPPLEPGTTRLYLSGPDALTLSETLATPELEVHVVSESVGDASALKLAYSAWTKGSAALLLAAREAAARAGVERVLLEEWRTSQPGLLERSAGSRRTADLKGWRFAGEMEEIASMFRALGLPSGFHEAAAEVFGSAPRP